MKNLNLTNLNGLKVEKSIKSHIEKLEDQQELAIEYHEFDKDVGTVQVTDKQTDKKIAFIVIIEHESNTIHFITVTKDVARQLQTGNDIMRIIENEQRHAIVIDEGDPINESMIRSLAVSLYEKL
ncbi:hypothetical protein [Desertibacillus haloalkaliphilus]|uniref:hypothetical protein n=1 Tax=Desertibacillus haloalkaliphilus TaxID=1328930 RepID=UPI001C2556D5|nr:hypothetical protein [Desertibacillus haloalkaliphilus]MBU8906169.1 hypothetical protein [Desertibacillus haloalkaliphilus]